jgi:hypothetical protein
VRHLVGGADATANKLRDCIQIACYGVADSTGYSHQLSREVAEQVGREHAERFWRTTEARFREILDNLTQSSNPSDEDQSIRRDWLDYIRREAIRIFDDDIAPEEAWNDDPKRLIYARSQLTFAFRPTYHGEKKNPRGVVWDALGLNPLPKQDNVKKNGADA